jgi:hypothetical protein
MVFVQLTVFSDLEIDRRKWEVRFERHRRAMDRKLEQDRRQYEKMLDEKREQAETRERKTDLRWVYVGLLIAVIGLGGLTKDSFLAQTIQWVVDLFKG